MNVPSTNRPVHGHAKAGAAKAAAHTANSRAAAAENKPADWLDKQDVRQMLNISDRTLQNWRTKKILPYYRIGGKIFYRHSDVEAILLGKGVA